MDDTARLDSQRKLLLANHFNLTTICGTTVMFAEVMRIAPLSAPDVALAYESYEPYRSANDWRAALEVKHADAACVVSVNPHIEVSWDLSAELFSWSQARGIPAYVYAHDYWPHHKENLKILTKELGGRILASTPFLKHQLDAESFPSSLVEVGVPLPDVWPRTGASPSGKVIASAGRLVPRKRLQDIVRAFATSGVDGTASLYLRVLPSNVFSATADDEQLGEIATEVARASLSNVTVDRSPGDPPDYSAFAAYVCSSSYEGFSMAVIEAAFHGCPPLMSNIPPHQRTARILFAHRAEDFLFPVGEHRALAAMIRDEVESGRRRAFLLSRLDEVRRAIAAHWSLARTVESLARLMPALTA
jgi:glycosyltransferase involved in cell wall biosynthesis